jgi:hypothetical protein
MSLEGYGIFFLFCFALLVLLFAIACAAARARRIRPGGRLTARDPSSLPPEIVPVVQEAIADLMDSGFSIVGYYEMQDMKPGHAFCLARLMSADLIVLAGVGCVWLNDGGDTQILGKYVAFTSRCQDGGIILTTSSSRDRNFVYGTGKRTFAFPAINDPVELYTLHRYILTRGGYQLTNVAAPGTDIDGSAEFLMDQNVDAQVKKGMLYRDKVENTFIPTWKGAIIMTAERAWPVSQLIEASARSNATKILTEFKRKAGNGKLTSG